MAEEVGKLTLRRLETPIHKFIKVVIPTDLERLQHHQNNIEKFHRSGQWDRLHQEHINASRTVQQLRSNLREMEKLCERVCSADAEALDKLVKPVKDRAATAAQNFLQLHSESVDLQRPPPNVNRHDASDPANNEEDGNGFEAPVTQSQLLLPVIPAELNAAESWELLEEDLVELSGLVNEFCSLVHAQQETIDSIEANVSVAAANVVEGTSSLGKAARSSLVFIPVAGAVVGTVLGGPLGLLAGYKLAGAAAAIGGGLLGLAGGSLIQRKKKERVELQLQQLSTNHPHQHIN